MLVPVTMSPNSHLLIEKVEDADAGPSDNVPKLPPKHDAKDLAANDELRGGVSCSSTGKQS